MRLALVLGRDGHGGSEYQAKLLANGLRDAGLVVDVFLVEGASEANWFEAEDSHVLIPERRPRARGLIDLIVATTSLRRYLLDGNYDVVHAIMARAYAIAPLSLLFAKDRPAVVAWRRNEGVHLRDRPLASALEWLAARSTDHVVCNSRSVRRHWIERRYLTPSKTSVIPNALESWRFHPVESIVEARATPTRIVSIGGLKPVKNHSNLISALALTRRDIELVILGEGAEHTSLQEQATELGVRLVLPGHVADPRPWLTSATIYAHPSNSEGMSNAILESMAAGCAIVATDVGAASELLGDQAGLVVPPRQPQALASAIQRMLDDTQLRTRLGKAARQRASSGFALQTVTRRHQNLYRELTKTKNA